MIIQKFLPIFISGLLLCGCASGAVNSNSEMETLYTENSKAETEDFVSTIDKAKLTGDVVLDEATLTFKII